DSEVLSRTEPVRIARSDEAEPVSPLQAFPNRGYLARRFQLGALLARLPPCRCDLVNRIVLRVVSLPADVVRLKYCVLPAHSVIQLRDVARRLRGRAVQWRIIPQKVNRPMTSVRVDRRGRPFPPAKGDPAGDAIVDGGKRLSDGPL